MSYYKDQLEAIRFHETTAARLREELDNDLQILYDEGIVSRLSDEDPVKATGKFVQRLVSATLVSAADIKEKVPSSRDLSHRAITAMLGQHPALVGTEEKDRHGLKCFRRIDELIITAEAAE
jgi:hypothetical protein